MELRNRRVLVVGLGRSGRAAARLCADHGARLTLTDSRDGAAFGDALDDLAGHNLELGGHRAESFAAAELIVVSPGVPPLPELAAAADAGVEVIGEMELASRFTAAGVVAITGTNGKSTTTKLAGELIAASGRPVFCGGNLGQPLSEAVTAGDPALAAGGVCVLEISSFQLETVARFHAHVAVLLNISEDHLDRYPDLEAYKAAKARVFERQTAADFAVTNADPGQAVCRQLAAGSAAPLLTFRSARSRGSGAWLDDDQLCIRLPRQQLERYPRAELRLPGLHNAQNALAALLAARLGGATVEGCRAALPRFVGLPHRMELVGERDDVRFFDDSKATNVGSVVGSLTGFERPVVLIAGGKDKGGDYAPLREVLAAVCRHVVLIGAAAARIEQALTGVVPLHHADDLPRAVAVAADLARPGDAVVLSPACSSYDMFDDFAHRGRVFAEAVAALPPEGRAC